MARGTIHFCYVFCSGRFEAGQHVTENVQRILAARIVRGEDDEIASFSCSAAHERALGFVAVASAAEEGDDFSTGDGYKFASQSGEIAEGIVGVGVIDYDGEVLAGVDGLETSGHAVRAMQHRR